MILIALLHCNKEETNGIAKLLLGAKLCLN
jgi:hypothetical protein